MNFHCFLADLIVIVHFAYVAFVVAGMAAIVAGIIMRWHWVQNFWFRAAHLLMIAVVVAESLGGVVCPLTDWEDRLRELGGRPNEPGGFLARWAHDILFIDISISQMTVYYVAFGLLVPAGVHRCAAPLALEKENVRRGFYPFVVPPLGGKDCIYSTTA